MTRRISHSEIKRFRDIVWQYYQSNGRNLAWRRTDNSYHILVSEIMLQQTQVERVIEKYEHFLSVFPDIHALAQAPLRKVLSVWQGLGYNRRALSLQRLAQEVIATFNGTLPSSENLLVKLPGIGKATASAIAAFAFKRPTVFIETNIRRVFIHFFFHDREDIKDTDILPLVEKTLDTSDPRHWYYALMDYGAMLKKQIENPNRKSFHYQRQSPFEGSTRQLRSMVLKVILQNHAITESSIMKKMVKDPDTVRKVLLQLEKEGFIKKQGKRFSIA